MRGFLLFLALAFPVALTSPFFWSIVNMEFGAERVGYVMEDGVTQWAMIGPLAPWPEWAPKPTGGDFTVRTSYEPAPGHMAMGFGEVSIAKDARIAAGEYAAQLSRAGWTVKQLYFDTIMPELPPRPMRWCLVEATKGVRSLMLRLDRDGNSTSGALHWMDGPRTPMIGAVEGAC
jgi:hypothetical protein